jgi:hypothetical protein
LPFEYHRSDIDEAPLGKLTNIFSKLTSDQEFVRRIRKLTKHRDTAAHRAFAHLYGRSTSESDFDRMSTEYLEISTEVSELLVELGNQQTKLMDLLEAH